MRQTCDKSTATLRREQDGRVWSAVQAKIRPSLYKTPSSTLDVGAEPLNSNTHSRARFGTLMHTRRAESRAFAADETRGIKTTCRPLPCRLGGRGVASPPALSIRRFARGSPRCEMMPIRLKTSDELNRLDVNGRITLSQPQAIRKGSPDRSSTPIRHRPPSPLKPAFTDALKDDRSQQLLDLAKKERALSDLRERKRELEILIQSAEGELLSAKRQLALNNNPLQGILSNNHNMNNSTRNILQKEKEMETLQHLAEGVSAIWKDVVHATMGDQATT